MLDYLMANPKLGSSYSFSQLIHAYGADPQADGDAHFLLYKGDEILALCLRHKFNPKAGEVWVGDDPAVAAWGKKLASLKGEKALPVYLSDRGRTLYTFKGDGSPGDTSGQGINAFGGLWYAVSPAGQQVTGSASNSSSGGGSNPY